MSILKKPSVVILAAALALAGCYDKEDRAEQYYQSALKLLDDGDETRAILEFRNVFKNDGFHKQAREDYAALLMRQGDVSGAYSQYLRLIEQYPDTLEVRQLLAEIAFGLGNWDEVERHAKAAIELAPDDPKNQNLELALDYRAAVLARDLDQRADFAATAEVRLESQPESQLLRRVLIDYLVAGETPEAAMPHIDIALGQDPGSYPLNSLKLRLLGRANDQDAVGVQLRHMVDLFPLDEQLRTSLLGWHMQQGDQAGALEFLREQAGSDQADPEGHMQVVQFLWQTQGRDAGVNEIARLMKANEGTPNYRTYAAFLAATDFEAGNRERALASVEQLLEGAEDGDQTNEISVLQADMLNKSGNVERAKEIVEDVLGHDPNNVPALKMRATWAISEDRTNDAILDLRSALSQAPQDSSVMTLLAAAHQRVGNRDLAGEQLANAVKASRSAPLESMRYARFLLSQGRTQAADTVLSDANSAHPGNVRVLGLLGDILIRTKQWPRASAVADILAQIDRDGSKQLAERMRASILLMQNRIDEGLDLLQVSATQDGDSVRPTLVVAVTQIQAGKTQEARVFIDESLERFPDSVALRLLSATLYAVMGEPEVAEPIYKVLLAEDGDRAEVSRLYYGFLRSEGRAEEATALLDAAMETHPDDQTILLFKAGELETSGNIEETIKLYERLYAADSESLVFANNLASLLVSYRDDSESLERAYTLSRRLRGTKLPHFQDTYGWVLYRRGDLDEALSYLEPAAKGLPNDPMVQYHFAMILNDLGRSDDAIARFDRVLELSEGKGGEFFVVDAKSKLEALTTAESSN